MPFIACPLQASSYIEPWYYETIYQFALKMPFKVQLSFPYVGLKVDPDGDPEFGDEPLPRIRKSMLLSTSFCSELFHPFLFSRPPLFFSIFKPHIHTFRGGGNTEDNEFSQKCSKGFFWFPCFVIGAVSVVRRSQRSILKAQRKRKRKLSNPVSCYTFFPRKSYLICSPLGAAFSFKVFWVSDVRLSFSPSVKESVYSAQAPFWALLLLSRVSPSIKGGEEVERKGKPFLVECELGRIEISAFPSGK